MRPTMNKTIDILGISGTKINMFPENIVEEIIQNIRIILTTIVGSVPLDRKFGTDAAYIDDPAPRGKMKQIIFITESIQEYEPRAEVTEVDFQPDVNNLLGGRLFPKVRVRIKDEFII